MSGRFLIMVLDGVGAGALPDAEAYGDVGANTLGNVARLVPLQVPVLQGLGLGNILPLDGVPPVSEPLALPGVLAELSAGKDTTAGHWEHMGVVTTTPFPTYPQGFPPEVIDRFEAATGRKVLGNKAASGTEIIAELGDEHLATGSPIVYTSADSVFQIAAHTDVIPLEELYRLCELARGVMSGRHAVGRVIARPFTGVSGAFTRTKDRKDFSLAPTGDTYLDLLVEEDVPVIGIGKIYQIYAGRGVTEQIKAASNADNLRRVTEVLDRNTGGLIFTNLVDFDMAWGHRNDVEGFAAGLEEVDRALPGILNRLDPDDRLLITADHGVDPTTVSTDHSREYVPLLYYPRPPGWPDRAYVGTMADTGATAYRHLTGKVPHLGGTPLEEGRPARGWREYPTVLHGGPTSACGGIIADAAAFIHARFGSPPETAVILGSGLDAMAEALEDVEEIPYGDIPGWATGTVPGHSGRLSVGLLAGVRVAVLRGRVHGYEGHDAGQVQLAVRTMACWGCRRVVVTNASGGIDPALRPGEVAVVERVLDFQTLTPIGVAPELLAGADAAAAALLASAPGTPPRRTLTYAALPGPHYETAAEVAVLRGLGVEAVGMSTAGEVRAARELGLRVAVLTVVTNVAGMEGATGEAVHAEVVAASNAAAREMTAVVETLTAGPWLELSR
ncbi:MAG: phosphopentomutase [Thermoleophilia bacterium]